MLRLYGIPVSEPDARRLVASLLIADGSPDAMSAAAIVSTGLDEGRALVPLTSAERTAILAQLEDPPDGLAELRGVLMRDHTQRHGT